MPNTRSEGRSPGTRRGPRKRLSCCVKGCSPLCEPLSRRTMMRRSCHWMSDQRRSHSSEMRRPWLKAIQIAAASRAPLRFFFAALQRTSTSSRLRCSRGRRSSFDTRFGLNFVPFSAFGAAVSTHRKRAVCLDRVSAFVPFRREDGTLIRPPWSVGSRR